MKKDERKIESMSFVSLVTVRAKNISEESDVREFIEHRIIGSIKLRGKARNIRIVKCVNCPGEYTWISEWGERKDIDTLEDDGEFQALFRELEERFLRVPPKREVWEILH